MAGIYIHIPFCRQACYYCNFHFSTSLGLKEEMIRSLVKEIEIRSVQEPGSDTSVICANDTIETIYFGGGTPSLLSEHEIFSLIAAIRQNYHLDPHAEITLEANPDDITLEKLKTWNNAGVNRLSIGIQSFAERDLAWMNRAHNAAQALHSIHLSRAAGFHNFSIDLIFGTPGLTDEQWTDHIQKAIDLQVPHVSAYALTVEPKTALHKMILLKKKEDVNSDVQARQYSILMDRMQGAGYQHYEISNFAKPGLRSRHNSSYWQDKKYIGIGPSAHSYNGEIRMWNQANNAAYLKSLQQGVIPFEKEILTETQKINEYIMTSLRTMEGLDLGFLESRFSKEERSRIENLLQKIEQNNIQVENDTIILTARGKLFADGIAATLFV